MATFEIINTGTELLLGRTLNTHHQWLARQLCDLALTPLRQSAVADTGVAIQEAVREALTRADLIVVTGGLGPTSDDLTRDKIAELLGQPLRLNAAVLAKISQFYVSRNRPMPETTKVQAMVPEGARVVMNQHGTAPGLAMRVQPNPHRASGAPSWLVLLPGPPRELRPMFTSQVRPWLREEFPANGTHVSRTLRTTGLGESQIEESLAAQLTTLTSRGLEVGYCAQMGQVELRFSAQGATAAALVTEAEALARRELGPAIFGEGDDTLEAVIIHRLTERRQTVALAESCTGGMISHRLTNVPGASAVFLGGMVTYSNAAKVELLGVDPATLASEGAVSEAVAKQMAEGARRRLKSDYAISVTGIAGPSGGTPNKPVGTVFIGLATAQTVTAVRHFNPVDRETFKWMTSQQALDRLRHALIG
jgi:nicotinamide-nucleotide amidase